MSETASDLSAWNLFFKRFYTRGTTRSIKISRLAKIPNLYRDWLRDNYLSCTEGKGVWKTFTVVHKKPRYLLIYYKISFLILQWFLSPSIKLVFNFQSSHVISAHFTKKYKELYNWYRFFVSFLNSSWVFALPTMAPAIVFALKGDSKVFLFERRKVTTIAVAIVGRVITVWEAIQQEAMNQCPKTIKKIKQRY